jgi:hypothetical protein
MDVVGMLDTDGQILHSTDNAPEQNVIVYHKNVHSTSRILQ